MKTVYTRSTLMGNLQSTYSSPATIRDALTDPEMPQPLVDWLTSLALLHGVPFNYLVPDEAMIPPESIRFFYLDSNWIAALGDGAMSIGRNLSPETDTPEMNLQKAIDPGIATQVYNNVPQKRANAFGMLAEEADSTVISGFLMRSSLVLDYPSMGVNAFAFGHTPSDPDPVTLQILRLEQLGPTSDTLICLVAGDIYRVDIHEAPQALHYGIDCFEDDCKVNSQPVTAVKNLYTFGNTTTTVDGVTTNAVTMSTTVTPTAISSCFRTNSPRVVGMDALAQLILQANKAATPPPGTTAPTSIDSAEMGFEMTEGVGMVSFYKTSN